MTTSFMVGARGRISWLCSAPTRACGPRLKAQMTTSAGKAVSRVLKASLKQHLVPFDQGQPTLGA